MRKYSISFLLVHSSRVWVELTVIAETHRGSLGRDPLGTFGLAGCPDAMGVAWDVALSFYVGSPMCYHVLERSQRDAGTSKFIDLVWTWIIVHTLVMYHSYIAYLLICV